MGISATHSGPQAPLARATRMELPKLDKFVVENAGSPDAVVQAEMRLDAIDTDNQKQPVSLHYRFRAHLREDNGALQLAGVAIWPAEATECDYRFRPGARGTAAFKHALMETLAQEYPQAETVTFKGARYTDGYHGPFHVEATFPLGRYRTS